MRIELNINGVNGIKTRYFKNKTFSHITGNQIKLLPFKTNPSGDLFIDDFKSFKGIIGELFRLLNHKSQIEFNKTSVTFKKELKEIVLRNAISKVETENEDKFKNTLSRLFFDEENGLIKFNIETLSYMNFIESNNAIKEVPKFIFDIFLTDNFHIESITEDINNENILHQLIIQCLPKLPDASLKSKGENYYNILVEINEQFTKDFDFLKKNNSLFLRHIEDFFKYYYFHYLNQLILSLNDFGNEPIKIRPVYYSMDWETLSETRLSSHYIGWKQLNKYSESLFAHINTLELLNYIYIDGKTIKDYYNIGVAYNAMSNEEKETFERCVDELIYFYTENITVFDTNKNWDNCDHHLQLDLQNRKFESPIHQKIYVLWFKIKYQFENSSRGKPYNDYSKWYSHFGKVNFTKYRGRLGNTNILSQELLLFLTRICIGSEEKIRLKTLWEKLKYRGIDFDETTKLEITKLFEKINLIEKKSDSGDAQYVKSTI